MQQVYQWHNPHRLYPDRGKKSYRMKRLRYRFRSFLNRGLIAEFSQWVNQDPMLANLLNERVNYSYPLVHRFLDKRFSAQQRLEAIKDNLSFLPKKLPHLPLWQQSISFGEIIDDFEILLNHNEHQTMEGYWALELRYKPENKLVYLLTFGKIEGALLIAVIQGPNFEGSKELVKQLTKQCYGLRPAYLMVEAMKSLTTVLGYPKLLGIPQKYQNKSRLIQSTRYTVDYDEIFTESSGELGEYWILPTQFNQKNLEDIPSKKRAMYRKRYAMLEKLQYDMKNALS